MKDANVVPMRDEMFTSTKSEHKLMISKANLNVVPMRDERCENQRDNCSTDLEMRERRKGFNGR